MALKWEEEICCEINDTCRKHRIYIWYFLGLNIELLFGPKWMDFFKTLLKNSICTEECTNHKHTIWWIFMKWTHPFNQPPRWISFNCRRGKEFSNSSPEKVLLAYSIEFALMLLLVLIRVFFSAISLVIIADIYWAFWKGPGTSVEFSVQLLGLIFKTSTLITSRHPCFTDVA